MSPTPNGRSGRCGTSAWQPCRTCQRNGGKEKSAMHEPSVRVSGIANSPIRLRRRRDCSGRSLSTAATPTPSAECIPQHGAARRSDRCTPHGEREIILYVLEGTDGPIAAEPIDLRHVLARSDSRTSVATLCPQLIEDRMSDKSNGPARPLIGFITRDDAPQITPAPVSRAWMSETREGVAYSVFADAHR